MLWYVQSGGFKAGDRLPPERELADMLGVSRTALRGAITKLISMGVLESRRGSGPYVRAPKPVNIFQEAHSLSDIIRSAGFEPSSRLLDAHLFNLDAALAAKLSRPVGSPAFVMSRVRLADEVPVAVETVYLNYAVCPGIEKHDFAVESLYDVLNNEYNVYVKHGTERLSITYANKDEAELLQVPAGAPVYFESALECAEDMTPVEYVKAVLNPGRLRFASNGLKNGQVSKVGATWLRL